MYVLIAVFNNEDEANLAQKKIESFVEWSNLQTDVPDSSVISITDPGGQPIFEQEITDDDDDDDEDEDDYTPEM